MSAYGVAATVIHRGRIKQNHLVLGKVDAPHGIKVGTQEEAIATCTKMRKAQAQATIPNGETIYTVVPLPVTA